MPVPRRNGSSPAVSAPESTENDTPRRYAEVLLPLNFRERVTYAVPPELETQIVPGSIVRVTLVGRLYTGVVREVSDRPGYTAGRIIALREAVPFPPLTETNLAFIDRIADYYLCSKGEVFRAAAPSTVRELKRRTAAAPGKAGGSAETMAAFSPATPLPALSDAQETAAAAIRRHFRGNDDAPPRNVLLNGITGSGKTEIYIHLAAETMAAGRNVLYLLPEIAVSRQLESRLRQVFGEHLLVYHSAQTPARKRAVYEAVAGNGQPYLVLGLRSALFLPFRDLGLVIVDEEHDTSYKQDDPAPRYHGRDAALLLGQLSGAPVLLGSATPSLETCYNVRQGRIAEVRLESRFYGGEDAPVEIVDMRKARRSRAVKGSFSLTLLRAVAERLERGEQCLIFRSRRAYATILECPQCGYTPRCPHCNIHLSYHKFNHSLSCHYCGYTEPAPYRCPSCRDGIPALLGSGTERLEEELRSLFPAARIDRFDADTAQRPADQRRILERFARHETDLLVGTQMIAKGFDFPDLTLTAVIQAETLTALMDFRADERALQLLLQLRGRAGRRDRPSRMIIQTNLPEHSVFEWFRRPEPEAPFGLTCTNRPLPEQTETPESETVSGEDPQETAGRLREEQERLLDERRTFGFPPYVRLIRLTLRDTDPERLRLLGERTAALLRTVVGLDFTGPTPPPVDRIQDEYLLHCHLRIPRDRRLESVKKQLMQTLSVLPRQNLVLDVDPVGNQ